MAGGEEFPLAGDTIVRACLARVRNNHAAQYSQPEGGCRDPRRPTSNGKITCASKLATRRN
eukprot:6193046-Pleurochrysis_carterae.AAC.1